MKAFRFKQFAIRQDRCAMKVGTDGVLLGAWAALDHQPDALLDVGAGTGIVALMLAQRSDAPVIDALEIDPNAYTQATDNFENSPWNDRLFCYHASFQEFVAEISDPYDLIVCNPPFFHATGAKSKDKQRNLARFEDALPFEDLVCGAAQLLSERGYLALIIPFSEEKKRIEQAQNAGLFAQKITRVRGNPDSEIKRSLLQLGFENTAAVEDELCLEISRHQYTPAYKALTQDFYLDS